MTLYFKITVLNIYKKSNTAVNSEFIEAITSGGRDNMTILENQEKNSNMSVYFFDVYIFIFDLLYTYMK